MMSISKIVLKLILISTQDFLQGREYIYQITEDFNPLNRMYYWHCKWPINQKRLNECSNLLLGEHDLVHLVKFIRTKIKFVKYMIPMVF